MKSQRVLRPWRMARIVARRAAAEATKKKAGVSGKVGRCRLNRLNPC